ncbi:MAG: dTMP kinase [bacterium]|nr:dTMP kinase [bacterium]
MDAFKALIPRDNFFAFEGGEGSGKTTQAKLLTQRLREKGYEVCNTHEPGGTLVGERIREVLLDPKLEREILPFTSACLFAAFRYQWVTEIVQPMLHNGNIVLTDRSFLATLVYQSLEGVKNEEFLHRLCVEAMGGIMPSTIFLLDISIDTMFKRLIATTRYDKKDRSYHEKVFESYRAFARKYPERIEFVDGEQPMGKLADYLYGAIKERIV